VTWTEHRMVVMRGLRNALRWTGLLASFLLVDVGVPTLMIDQLSARTEAALLEQTSGEVYITCEAISVSSALTWTTSYPGQQAIRETQAMTSSNATKLRLKGRFLRPRLNGQGTAGTHQALP